MTSEDKEYHVEIGMNADGEALVKVSISSDDPALVDNAYNLYHDTIEKLNESPHPVASPFEVDVRITNENSERIRQCTVSGRDSQTVTQEYFKIVKHGDGRT